MVRRTPLVLASPIATAVALLLGAAPALAGVIVVNHSIQAAIDAAHPGDTILVPRGTYHECPVVDKSGLTIAGPREAVIDATGCENGLTVGTGSFGTDPDTGLPTCPPISIEGFTLRGLTIENADPNGVFLVGVSHFHVTGGKYLANREYGIFPRCSTDGLIAGNVVDGAKVAEDAGIYVGIDQRVDVQNNLVTGSPIGIEVENSLVTRVRWNVATGNTLGVLAVVLPGLPTAATDDVLIEGNTIFRNNLPNPFAPTDPDDIALIPTGTGILNVGADHVVIRRNVIVSNDTVGVAILRDPFDVFDPRIEPLPDHGEMRQNYVVGNGAHPDPARPGSPSADIVYDGSSPSQCFADNVFGTDFPAGITALFECTARI
jgi:parallel beta-helix repeat protein